MRGIVAGSVLRRLVGKTLAAQFGDAVQAATAPYQFALGTRAGTDALALTLRVLSDARNTRLTDLAVAAGVDKASALRLLDTLAAEGFIERDPDTKAFTLGPEWLALRAASVRRIDPRASVRPALSVATFVPLGRDGLPHQRIWPADGISNPANSLSKVLLPQPEGPSSETNSPGLIASLTRSSATVPLG